MSRRKSASKKIKLEYYKYASDLKEYLKKADKITINDIAKRYNIKNNEAYRLYIFVKYNKRTF